MPGTHDRHRPPRLGGRDNVLVLAGLLLATALIYLPQPVVALLGSAVAIAGGTVFLVQDRPGRPAVIVALMFSGFGLMWTLVQLGVLY